MKFNKSNEPITLEGLSLISQRKQFWMLQFGGWLAYALVVFLAIVRPQLDTPGFNFSGQIINLFAETLCGFALSYFQWRLISKIVHLSNRNALILSFVSATILGLIYNVFKLSFYKVIVFNQQWNEAWNMLEFGGWFVFSLTTMFVWTSIYFIMLYNHKLQKEHEMLLRAQTTAKEAQLQMLRYQLNPHFMFNTMNAISTLIYKKDNDTAGEMLDKLCSFFRYSLMPNTAQKSNLTKEIELLELYLSIEKVRFGERLSVSIDVGNDTLFAQVPPLFLQPIVENAVKYGVEPRKEPSNINISASKHNNRLKVTVFNDGVENKQQDSGFGIGLSNTRDRLMTMYNNDIELMVRQVDGGTCVSIEVPFIKVEKLERK
ncbi:sensor histidine kinase [Thalassotalea atypica]|uniref:sensor histidine kinase n=1 Tax=Thalassotalea atypica TaxID=2054316 RepID=UPI00257341ED|nr:histidine kinase [Thalassotalea atypica]